MIWRTYVSYRYFFLSISSRKCLHRQKGMHLLTVNDQKNVNKLSQLSVVLSFFFLYKQTFYMEAG